MRAYIIRRLIYILPTLVLVSFMLFVMIRLMPGDMIDAMLTETPLRTAPLWLMGSSVAHDRIVAKLEAEGKQRRERRKKVPQLLASARQRLLEAREQEAAIGAGQGPPELINAQGTLLEATILATEAEIAFDDVPVGTDDVLIAGDPGDTEAFKVLLGHLNHERCGNASMCVGAAQGALEYATRHLNERVIGGEPLADRQGLQWKLADMAIELESARLLLRRAVHLAGDGGTPPALETAMAKAAVAWSYAAWYGAGSI